MTRKRLPTASETVAKSVAKSIAAGGERLTLTLTPADAANWRNLLARYGDKRGAKMQAFRDAVIAAINERAIDIPAELERLARELRQKGKTR